MKNHPGQGIIERIKNASSPEEVDALLSELSTYKDARPRTIRRARSKAKF